MALPRYSLNNTDWVELPVSWRYAGIRGGINENNIIEIESDAGGIRRYNPAGPVPTSPPTPQSRFVYEFEFQCETTQLSTFDTMIAATQTVPLYFQPEGASGATLYVWRELDTYRPRVISGLQVGAEVEFTLGFKKVVP